MSEARARWWNRSSLALTGGVIASLLLAACGGTSSTATGPTLASSYNPVKGTHGGELVYSDWRDRCDARGCTYLNPAGFVSVPVSSVTNATLRPGTYMLDMARGPSSFNLHTTLAKSFALQTGR